MLNRLYIVVGFLAILVLAAAFVVPSFIPWGNYRGRMETLATEALGAEVRIKGDIHFALLPAPHLVLGDVSVGPASQPVVSVKSADADFSLVDFLRDRYSMTRLVLEHPLLDLKVKPDGSLDWGLKPATGDSKANLSVANATIAVGTLRVADQRTNQTYTVDGIDGELSIGAIRGPIAFSGGGSLGDQHYNVRLSSGPIDGAGTTQVSLLAKPDSGAFSIEVAGSLATAGTPELTGDLTYRQSPPASGDTTGITGDLTFTGKLDATPQKLTVGDYTLVPDENRAVTRLSGTLTVDLGARPSFSATVSSGVLALPPRDATTEKGPQPYELVRLLGELPVPPVPPLGGSVAVDVGELNLRSFSLQNVKLLATTDGEKWTVASFTGRLPGNTAVQLAGDLDSPDGRPSFSGSLAIGTTRLDTLSGLWRKPASGNPLFNLPASFTSKVSLLGTAMALTDGKLTIDGVDHALTALVRFGKEPRIDLSGQFTDLSASDSAALLALVPDWQQDTSAAVTFPQGAVSLAADSASIFGLPGRKLDLEGKWANGTVELSKLAAADLGGVSVDVALKLSGTLAAPRISGDGTMTIAAGGGPALDLFFQNLGTPQNVRAVLRRSLPADLKLHLDDPAADGGQGLSVSGKAGAADVTLVAQLGQGIVRTATAPIEATLDVGADNAGTLTSQLGLGDTSLLPETGPAKLSVSATGSLAGTLKGKLDVEGGGDQLAFDGTVTPGDLTGVAGQGKLKLALSDTSALAALAGMAGIAAPPVKGDADIKFVAGKSLTLDNFSGSSGPTGFSGSLALASAEQGNTLSGSLTLDRIELGALVGAAAGPTALMASAGKVWPDGPLAIGDGPRRTVGSVAVKTPAMTLGGSALLENAGFDFGWDGTQIGIHNLNATLQGGTVQLDASLCCAGPIADKQLTGEASLKGVPLGAVVPPAVAENLSGNLDGSVRFNSSGDSLDALAAGLSGDGSFALANLVVQKFDPHVFADVAGIANITDLDPGDLGSRVAAGLDAGAFSAAKLGGGFSLAGGTLRVANLAADTPSARLFGGVTLGLENLALGGSFALTPVGTLDAAGLVSETTSKITANLSGTLAAPQRALDIASMVDAIKVRALEVEVARLEALKAADDARQRAAVAAAKEATEDTEARQLADAQAAAKKAADDAAAKAAADAAARKAADDAAAAKAAADAAARKAAQQAKPAPVDIGIPTPGTFQ